MNTNIKYIVFTAFMLYAGAVTAQNSPNKRALQVQAIEQEVQEFIIANRANYNLTPERISNLQRHSAESKSDKALLEQMLTRAKDLELRKLYFKENPEAAAVYQTKSMEEIRYICDNGDIEDGYTDDYEFETDQVTGVNFGCGTTYSLVSITPSATVNDFTEPVTLVNDDTGVSGGFDPVLYGFSIEVPRINSGTTAVKLNNNSGDNEVTKMSKTFTVDSNIISFSYSFIANSRLADTISVDDSYFTAKLYKTSDNSLIEEFCLQADATNTAAFDGYVDMGFFQYVYTGWQCQTLSLQGVPFGTEVRLEFTVNDNDTSGYGTVYLDDICDDGGECQPRYGKLILDVNEIKCDPLPIQVCGVYQLPFTTNTDPVITGTLDSLELNIYESDGTTLVTTLTSATVGDNNFCFEVEDTDLGSPLQDEYEFEVIAEYTILGYTYTLTDFSSNLDFDLDFSECSDDCLDDLVITTDVASPTNDSQQANETITAYNTVNDGATAIYHAGTEVLLLEDFESLYGSTGHYYIEGCTDVFEARPAPVQETAQQTQGDNTIDLVEKHPGSNFKIYPNPAQNELNIITDAGVSITKMSLYSIDGKLILQAMPNDSNKKYIVDISSVSKGIYVMSVETNDGKVTSVKVVKN
ncbi:T9SS type A sorting domain-containing protein [Flavobacterium sp. LaA7.5]|nr:T9SS type A sorting domain-containing protein [Flavobacterium salilacus subsp. altitudinum]